MADNDGISSEPDERVGDGAARAADPYTADAAPRFYVVGIGASAGGLEALEALIRHLKYDNMAFVIVQHLARTHESALPALLARASKLPVATATHGTKIEPGHIYVIPPNTDLAILHGVLQVFERHDTAGRLPIDFFFRSLADDQGAHSIGIVLSGTGSDGTFGLKAIKNAGGLTFAQDPASAKYDGMPRSALESGWADASLTPQAIAEELVRIGRLPDLADLPKREPEVQNNLTKIVVLIRAAFGNDLSHYKTNTVERRIARRMALRRIDGLEDYVALVQSNTEELRHLYKDMLIGVTSFFRDREPFDVLKARVFPRMMEGKPPGSSIRIWVPACSSGEEAYSIAMCLLEHLDDKAQDYRIQIFGTDIDDDSIQEARRGIYPLNIALDVSPARLHRFFVKYEDDYQINRSIRDLLVFSTQNITKDPPFSRLDLVSCRNLLIYLQPAMQKKVMRVLHYALGAGGFLLLGNSETVGDSANLFSMFDQKNHIYVPKFQGARSTSVETAFSAHPSESPASMQPGVHTRPGVNIASMADRKILELYGPPGVVINENLDVLHFRGNTGRYLGPAPGAASLNILRLARTEIHADLRRTIHEALTDNKPVSVQSRLRDETETRPFRLDVLPMIEPDSKSRCLLVLFHETPPEGSPVTDGAAAENPLSEADQRALELERELLVAKEYLQNTIEELESANEELKASNEELQSSNEELQSTNEELETSKEEMQSTNEELTTVNDELKARMTELQQTYDDLHNVMTGVDNAVIITGMDLRIRRFTHAAEETLNLVQGDVGRSIGIIDAFVGGDHIEKVVSNVIATLQPFDERIRAADHRFYRLRIVPYRTMEHTIKGSVVILSKTDAQERAIELSQDVAEYASKFLQAIGHPLLIVNGKLRVVWANEAFFSLFQVVPEEVVGTILSRLGSGQWSDPKLLSLLTSAATSGHPFRDFEIRHPFPDIGEKAIKVGGSRIPPLSGESVLILLSFEEGPARRSS
jgi:two-component system CheB/CheR fusion protein